MTRILGVDPGSRVCGFAVIDYRRGCATHITHGIIRPRSEDFLKRLHGLYTGLREVIATHGPATVAMEDIFVAKSASSALKLGQARGALLIACAEEGLEVTPYPPNIIKKAVTGFGVAEKGQVQHMIRILFGLSSTPPNDAADALAVALCHAHHMVAPGREMVQ